QLAAALAPARDVHHAVHGLAHEHVALLELNKSNRGSPWTAISRFNRRSRVLMVGRPSAPSLDSSTRLSLALGPRSLGSLSCCRRRRHWSVSHVWLTPRRRAMAGHVSGSSHRATSCASSGWFTNMSRPPDQSDRGQLRGDRVSRGRIIPPLFGSSAPTLWSAGPP